MDIKNALNINSGVKNRKTEDLLYLQEFVSQSEHNANVWLKLFIIPAISMQSRLPPSHHLMLHDD
jgi:hypothetical protein